MKNKILTLLFALSFMSSYALAGPSISGVTPLSVLSAGGWMTIHGDNFHDITSVKFGNNDVSYEVKSPNEIGTWAPYGVAGTYSNVVVTDKNGDSASHHYYYLPDDL